MMGGFGGCCGSGWLGGFGGFGWFGLIFNLLPALVLFLGLIVFLTWLFRQLKGRQAGESPTITSADLQSSPKEILAIRYARGEIDHGQFMKMAKDLD
jgi:uncharacterized membrane protein